jgi:hypothetical protein
MSVGRVIRASEMRSSKEQVGPDILGLQEVILIHPTNRPDLSSPASWMQSEPAMPAGPEAT